MYRSFTYRMARDRQDEAMAILRDALVQGEAQRSASVLSLPEDRVPAVGDNVPEIEPDPFAAIFYRQMHAESFPGTVFPSDRHPDDRRSSSSTHRRGRHS
ncbi:hypothetical protein DTX79_19275 [Bacilli bacterium]|nr:hypothetical protein DTX79_19275 [Bacilli bacterium]